MAHIDHIDLDDEQFEDTSKALRDYAASLKRKLAKAEALVSTYREELANRTLGAAVKTFANPERVKEALLADEVDPLDAEAVQAWLSANGDDYAKAQGAPAQPNPVPAQVAQNSAEPHEGPGAEGLQFDPEQEQFERWLEASGQGRLWAAPTEGSTNER